MLYSADNFDKNNPESKIPHQSEFTHWKNNIKDSYNEIESKIKERINGKRSINSSYFGKECLNLPEFQPIKDACKDEDDIFESSGFFFGIILFKIMMEKEKGDDWIFMKSSKTNGKEYNKLK